MIYDLLESDEKGLRYTRLKLREPANSILRNLHFTTDYTCMIVYVTNNKEP